MTSSDLNHQCDITGPLICFGLLSAFGMTAGTLLYIGGHVHVRGCAFVAGVTLGGSTVANIVAQYTPLGKCSLIPWALFLFGGLVFGVLSLHYMPIALLVIASMCGVQLAFITLTCLAYTWPSLESDPYILPVLIALLSGACMLCVLKYPRGFIISSTTSIGAYMLVCSFSALVERLPILADPTGLLVRLHYHSTSTQVPDSWWIIWTVYMVLTSMGISIKYTDSVTIDRPLQKQNTKNSYRTTDDESIVLTPV